MATLETVRGDFTKLHMDAFVSTADANPRKLLLPVHGTSPLS